MQCLKVRAERVCDEGKRWQEIQYLRQVFRANGYPEPIVKSNLRGRPINQHHRRKLDTPKLLLLSYICQKSQ